MEIRPFFGHSARIEKKINQLGKPPKTAKMCIRNWSQMNLAPKKEHVLGVIVGPTTALLWHD
jgi:hypothetical protein